eukprot:5270124-Prymnesium_polylepis.1
MYKAEEKAEEWPTLKARMNPVRPQPGRIWRTGELMPLPAARGAGGHLESPWRPAVTAKVANELGKGSGRARKKAAKK